MREVAKNLLIEASAGTGKTQALANRLITLLAFVKPQEMVALTFSRAAAGEIFERFVTLLANKAESEEKAALELREVIAHQHLSQIGTLDSFLMRIVRSFPFELKLAGKVEMLDEYRAGIERGRISFSILRRADAATRKAFFEAFSLAMDGQDVRSFVETYRKFIKDWHEVVCSFPEEKAWGDAAKIFGSEGKYLKADAAALAAAAEAILATGESELAPFAEWVRGFRGSFAELKGAGKKIFEAEDLFDGERVEFFFRKQRSFGGKAAQAIREAVLCVCGYELRRKLSLARGIYRLISEFERVYAQRVRTAGRLVFADVPRLVASLDPAVRLALEYRLDARFTAWALDEFQDTSRAQWRAIANLVEEAKQSDDEHSVFVVGDRKQAIYGWREGDVGIFEREKESGIYQLGQLVKTYRSGPAVVEAVNRIFARGIISGEYPKWSCPEHESAHSKVTGFVQTLEAPNSKKDDFIDPVANALRAVDPVGRGISAAVLVRDNIFGARLAEGLKARGIEGVVWEGESAIYDTPLLSPFLDLLVLADHPGDEMTYRHFKMTPLARALYPAGVPSAVEISREFCERFTAEGLVRVLREMRATLPAAAEAAWDEFSECRFTDMLRAAAEYEGLLDPTAKSSGFVDFLNGKKQRSVAEPGKIKVMTIHRSKGLGFDYVVLPLYEKNGLLGRIDKPLMGEGWVLPEPNQLVRKFFPALAQADALRKERVEQEALCVYYVAFTRAKVAMTVICHPSPPNSKTRRFSDFVRMALGFGEIGDAHWYEAFQLRKATASVSAPSAPAIVRAPRKVIVRRMPSLSFENGQSAGSLFARSARVAAMKRGEEIHLGYEKIEWADESVAAKLPPAFREAFVKPSPEAEVWRERAYEILSGEVWESGQFDRVVFTGDGALRSAVIYDFKTNAKGSKESDEAFAQRLAANYGAQLAAYRRALAKLTGIPSARIIGKLLLAANGLAVQIL